MPRDEIRIVLFYLGVGVAWTVATDYFLGYYNRDTLRVVLLTIVKGSVFILGTGLLLYLALRRSFDRRRRAEEALRQSYERFELTARAVTDAIYDLDLETNRMWWSEGFHKLFGYTTEEVQSTYEFWTNQLHPDEKEAVVSGLRAAIQKGQSTWSCEYRFRRLDGTYAYVYNSGCITRDAQGRPVRMIGGMSDITERKIAQERLEQSSRQLRALSARLESLREEERTHISREIHDELGQSLTALKMDLRWLEKHIGERDDDLSLLPILDKAVEAGEIADAAIASVQKIASELRPGTLDNLGLAAAIRYETAKFQERTSIRCDVRLPEDPFSLLRDTATAVFRIFQETLTNIARHAQASSLQVALQATGNQIQLDVVDDGKGISKQDLADPKSLGLLGMRERAGRLGGELLIEPVVPHGTRVTLRLPRGGVAAKDQPKTGL